MQHRIRLRRRAAGEVVSTWLADGGTLMDAVRAAGLPIASACDGDQLCARCGLEVLTGGDNLAPETAAEREVKARNRIDPSLRLACQVRPTGPVEATARYW